MNITEELAANVVDTKFSSIPEESLNRAKWRIIDTLGCLIGGANAAGCRGTVDLIKKWGGAEESTILTHGIKAPAHNVAMVNSLMARSFDYEPVQAEGETASIPAHISGTTIPTAIAMAEWQAANGEDLITALVLGDDLAARLGVASGFDFSLGWSNTGTINVFGATAIACKLLALGNRQVSNAFGIALNQLGGSMGSVWDKAMTFKLCMSLASRTGIFSAELAAQGFTGMRDPFTGKFGYFSLYCRDYDTASVTKNLGKKFYSDRVIKPYSACRITHSTIDSALKISCNNNIRAEDVIEIVVNAAPSAVSGFCGQPFFFGEIPQIEGAFSIRYTVATALLRKGVKPAFFTDECIRDPRIQSLIGRMKLVPGMPEKSLATEVRVLMKDGTELFSKTDLPKGDVLVNPLADEEIRAKFRDNVAYSQTVSVGSAEQALEMLETLESIADVREIVRLLA